MALRQGTALSDYNVYKNCPQFFSVPEKQALVMFLQPNEDFRGLKGVKKEKYLRVPPRPQNFNCMAQSLSKMYQNPEGGGATIQNLNRQFKQDIRQPVRLPTVSIASPDPPNRPNVLVGGVNLEQVLLEVANQVQQLGDDYAQQTAVNAQQAADLQEAQAQGIQLQASLEQTTEQLEYSSAENHWRIQSASDRRSAYDDALQDAQMIGYTRGEVNSMTDDAYRRSNESTQVHELLRLLRMIGSNLITGDPDGSFMGGTAPQLAMHGTAPAGAGSGGQAGPSTLSGAITTTRSQQY